MDKKVKYVIAIIILFIVFFLISFFIDYNYMKKDNPDIVTLNNIIKDLDEVKYINIYRDYMDIYDCPEGELFYNTSKEDEVSYLVEYLKDGARKEIDYINEALEKGELIVKTADIRRAIPSYNIEYLDENNKLLVTLNGITAQRGKREVSVKLEDITGTLTPHDKCIAKLNEIILQGDFDNNNTIQNQNYRESK